MRLKPNMKHVKHVFDNLDSFKFVPPAYFRSELCNQCVEYIRIHFTQEDKAVFSIRTQHGVSCMFIHEKFIKMSDYDKQGNKVQIKLSTEAETQKDMFQLMLVQDYYDITFEDIQICNKIYEHFNKQV